MEVYTPNISIVVPILNGAPTVASAIESLLIQEYPRERFEIIAVDNGSTDSTVEILSRYPVTVINASPQNRAAARNAGIRHASGEVIFCMDCDCIADRNWVKVLTAAFQFSEVAAVQGTITPNGAERLSYATFKHAHLGRPFLDTKGCAIRREWLEAVDLFNETLCRCEDIDLSWKILNRGGEVSFLDASGVISGVPKSLYATAKRALETAEGLRQVHRLWMDEFNLSTLGILSGFLSIGAREVSRRGARTGLSLRIRTLYLMDSLLTGCFYLLQLLRPNRVKTAG